MAVSVMSAALRPDRLALVGSLAVRPVAYRGKKPALPHDPFPVSSAPLHGLSVVAGPRRTEGVFVPKSNVHGFLNLPSGDTLLRVTDREKRFLPRTISVNVPSTAELREALERGGKVPPSAGTVPFITVPLRPSPASPLRVEHTAIYGVARELDGTPIRFAWVRATTSQGSYVTWSDLRGEIVIPLPFLRPAITIDDSDTPDNDGDDIASFVDLVDVTIRAHRLRAEIPLSDPLSVFPPSFDDLVPGTPQFDAVYEATSFLPAPSHQVTVSVKIDTHVRQDLTP